MKVLVTGASGFVGGAVIARLSNGAHEPIAASRSPPADLPAGVAYQPMATLGAHAEPLPSLSAAEVIVHAAARVHVTRSKGANDLTSFREVNVAGTLAIARQARAAGARRFIYVSTVKVLGEQSPPGRPLDSASQPAPADAYSISKHEAEVALKEFCSNAGMELVVVRPPLVYGPNVKANFERLMRAIVRREPLPFGRLTDNRRSLVALSNLVDLVVTCIDHPSAAGKTFLVSDGEDLSTAELVLRLAKALGSSARLWSMPVWMLRLAGEFTGRSGAIQRLTESLQVDITPTRRDLDWTPPSTVDDGLARTAAFFLART